ncbi:VOC family protein [Siphonobacter aquaeclarae]|uniref:hypothetical protein n=1 Tax=Siphonobacter aquaeclarae TaxID=563176 RepID=UPI001FDF16A6|nr:hypothetical protein [Siphonobacter aquaeclarae]
MKIEHLAIWGTSLEQAKTFYERNIDAVSGEKYENSARQSYFLRFGDGCRLGSPGRMWLTYRKSMTNPKRTSPTLPCRLIAKMR